MAFEPKPGPQKPDKYPQTGPNYAHYGEVYGFNYDPVTDTYHRDETTKPGYQKPQKNPGTLETLGYGAGAAALGIAAQQGGADAYNAVAGWFSDNKTPQTQPTQPTKTPQIEPTQNSGLVGSANTQTTSTPSGAISAGDGQGVIVAQGQSVPSGYTAVGTSADGGTYAVPTSSIESGSIDWGAIGQGATGAIQLYSAYQAYKDKDYDQAAVYGTQGAVNAAAAAGSTTAASVAPWVNAAAAIYTGGKGIYDTYNNDLMTDEQKATRAQQQVGLTYLDYWTWGGASLAEGKLREKYPSFFRKLDKLDRANPATWAARTWGSSKDEGQLKRDFIRDKLYEAELLTKKEGDSHHYIELADGSLFDVGVDGKNTFEGVEGDKLHPYDVDFKNPEAVRAAELLNPLTTILIGKNEKAASDFTGYFTNAALSNGAMLDNVKHIYEKAGLDKEGYLAVIDKMVADGRIEASEAEAFKSRAPQIFDGAPAAPKAPQNSGLAPAPNAQPAPQIDTSKGPNDPGRFPEKNSGLVGNAKLATSGQQIDPYRYPQSQPPINNTGLVGAPNVPTPQPIPAPQPVPTPQIPTPTGNIVWGQPGQTIPGYKPAPTFVPGGQPGQVAYVKDSSYKPNYGLIGAAV